MGTESPAIKSSVRKLGSDISRARRARGMPTADFAIRMGVSRSTLGRIEQGDLGVSIGNIASALQILGELGRIRELMDPSSDGIGLMLARDKLPQRIRSRKKPDRNADKQFGGQSDSLEPEAW